MKLLAGKGSSDSTASTVDPALATAIHAIRLTGGGITGTVRKFISQEAKKRTLAELRASLCREAETDGGGSGGGLRRTEADSEAEIEAAVAAYQRQCLDCLKPRSP